MGAGLSLGYMWRIGDHIGIEVGGGFWGGGLLDYARYIGINRMVVESGPKGFIAINDLTVSFHWIF